MKKYSFSGKIVDMKGNIVNEKTPPTVKIGLQAMKIVPGKLTNIVLNRLTLDECKKKKVLIEECKKHDKKCESTNKKIRNAIKSFIKDFDITIDNRWEKYQDGDSLDDFVNRFNSLDDFFVRKLSKNLLNQKKKIAKNYDFCSGADCRLSIFSNFDIYKKLWVKGLEKNLSTLFGFNRKLIHDIQKTYSDWEPLTISDDINNYYNNSEVCVFRLAPEDYHCYHSPFKGEIIGYKFIPGSFYSVNPTIVKSKIDVYGRNTRCVLFFKTKFGIVSLIAISATCVGSVQMIESIKKSYQKNKNVNVDILQEIGRFGFGGSTFITLIPENRIIFNKKIIENSKNGKETYVTVGEPLGKINKKARYNKKSDKQFAQSIIDDLKKTNSNKSMYTDKDNKSRVITFY